MAINHFRETADARFYYAGEVIFNEGVSATLMYQVREGAVDILLHDNTVMETVGAGGIIGEMGLIEFGLHRANAVARTACVVVPIDREHSGFMVHHRRAPATDIVDMMAE